MCKFTFIALITALCIVCLSGPSIAASYTAQALGVAPGYDGSWATDINEEGVVICASVSAQDIAGVFTWSNGVGLTDLSGHGIYAFAGINNRGQTAGLYTDTNPYWKFEPLIRNSDGIENRLHVPEGVSGAWVQKMLDESSIFVTYEYRNSDRELIDMKSAIIDANGSSTFIEAPESSTSINAVSNNGNVIVNNKYLWTVSGGFSTLSWLVNAGQVEVTCVNDLGWVVGTLNDHVVRWDNNGNMYDLGEGIARGINNIGQVVGSINDLAVIWNADGSVINLPSLPGYSYTYASAINDNGQVVGEAQEDGAYMAVLWQPVPEPSSTLALLCGIAGTGILKFRKRK